MTEINANKTKPSKKILLILDDVVCDYKVYQSPTPKKLFVRRRHINIAIILTF